MCKHWRGRYAEEVDESWKADAERDGEGVKESWQTFDDLPRVTP